MSLYFLADTMISCCGILELYELEAIKECTTNIQIKTAKQDLHSSMDIHETNMAIATTVSRQKHEITCLKKLGFKSKGKTKNPKTGNWITLWTYNR